MQHGFCALNRYKHLPKAQNWPYKAVFVLQAVLYPLDLVQLVCVVSKSRQFTIFVWI